MVWPPCSKQACPCRGASLEIIFVDYGDYLYVRKAGGTLRHPTRKCHRNKYNSCSFPLSAVSKAAEWNEKVKRRVSQKKQLRWRLAGFAYRFQLP